MTIFNKTIKQIEDEIGEIEKVIELSKDTQPSKDKLKDMTQKVKERVEAQVYPEVNRMLKVAFEDMEKLWNEREKTLSLSHKAIWEEGYKAGKSQTLAEFEKIIEELKFDTSILEGVIKVEAIKSKLKEERQKWMKLKSF